MGFWIFMLISDLLIPLTMYGFGRYFSKNTPDEINGVFGYRTNRSMINSDTWEFAHHYCGKLWLLIGKVMFVITLIVMLFVIGEEIDTIGTIGGIICAIQLVLLIGSIFPTEIALKKSFDKKGNRK